MNMDKKGVKQEERRLKLDLRHGFGSMGYTNIKEGVAFIEDNGIKVGFPIGKYFAMKALEKTEMNFLKMEDAVETLLCVAISKNRKIVAFSEKLRGESVPLVTIHNIQNANMRERGPLVFRYPDTKATHFVSMAFAYDDPRFLALLTGMSESQIIILDTIRMKPVATTIVGTGATRITLSPKDNHVIFVSGERMAKMLRINEGSIKNMKDIQKLNLNQKFHDHCWTDDQKLLITNDTGYVYLVGLVDNQFEVIQEIQNCFKLSGQESTLAAITIKAFLKGFIAGAENGTLTIWTKADDSEQADTDGKTYSFLRTRVPDFGRRSAVCSIDVSSGEEYAAFCFSNNDLAVVSFNQLIPSLGDIVDPLKLKKILEKDVNLEYLYNGFHNGPITALDVCLHRPFIVTCSRADSSIRIWNYLNPKCELGSRFYVKEEGAELNPLLSVAFHPTGYYLAAGFVDKLRVYHVLSEDLRKYKEVALKNCAYLKFSNGGHLLAVACPKQKASNYMITIFNAYTLEQITNMKANVVTLSDLMWTPNDEYLYSCGHDGAVYEWKTDDFSSRRECIGSGAKFYSIIAAPNGTILVCGTEQGKGVVKEIKNGEFSKTFPLTNCKLTAMCSITSLFKLGGIIGGTDLGQIKLFSGNFTGIPLDSFPSHNLEIAKLACSPDGKYVFSIGEDSTLFIYQVLEVYENGGIGRIASIRDEDTKELNPKADVVDKELADLILISRTDIEQHKSMIKALRLQIDDLGDKMEIKATEDRVKLEKEQAASKQKMHDEISKYEKQYEELKAQKIQLERDYANLLKQMKGSHMKAVEELENLYEKKLAFENEKYLQLEQALIEEKHKNIEKLKQIEKKHEETIEKLQSEYKDSFTRAHKVFENTKQTADNIKKEYEEKLNQQEQEHEEEIKELHAKYQEKIQELKSDIAEYKTKNDAYAVDNKNSADIIAKMAKDDADRVTEINGLKEKLRDANSQIENLKKEIEERDENIAKKEKKIYEFKYKISDLQKSKHVLSFRTTEMRKTLEPKEAQIENLKEELFKLEGEFESMIKASHIQNDKLIKTEKKIELLNANLRKQIEISNKKENLIHSMVMDIHNCVKSKEPKEWANEMKRLYQSYVINTEIKQESNDPRGIEEMGRQIQHLEKSLSQINKTTENMVKRRDKDIYRKTIENSDLICDLNELRQKNKEFEIENGNLRRENETLKKEKKNLLDEINKLKGQLLKRKDFGINKEGEANVDLDTMGGSGQIMSNPMEKKEKDNNAPIMPPIYHAKSEKNLSTLAKGRIIKGSMFDMRAQALNDKVKLSELQAENEIYFNKIIQQENEIKMLRVRLNKAGIFDEDGIIRTSKDGKPIPDELLSRGSSATQERKMT